MEFNPHPYQRYAIKRLLEQPATGIFLDMGLGKTVITLTALVELMHDRFEVARVLVIAPLRVAETTWPEEAAKWAHTRHLRIAQVLGTRRQREAALQESADIWVMNVDNVKWLVEHLGKDWPFDMVVIDELSSFKSSGTQRFRALRRVRPLIHRLVGLTGTPAPNGLIDLWAQMYLLDGGERLGKTVGGYRSRYFYPGSRNGYVVYQWLPKPEAEEAIYRELDDICMSMSAEDWLEVPERVDQTVKVALPAPAKKKYKQLERDLLLPFAGETILADSAGALSNKLLQLANGAVYDEDGKAHHVHDAKLDALAALIDEANGKPVLVFYAYRHDLARIQERFPEAQTLEGPDTIKAWNRKEIPLLLAHPASAGHGLNLQEGGNSIVWFGLTWSLELYQQAVARLHRQGQTERVIVYHLVTEGTVDEDVVKALAGKEAGQDALLEAVRARVEDVLAEGVITMPRRGAGSRARGRACR